MSPRINASQAIPQKHGTAGYIHGGPMGYTPLKSRTVGPWGWSGTVGGLVQLAARMMVHIHIGDEQKQSSPNCMSKGSALSERQFVPISLEEL